MVLYYINISLVKIERFGIEKNEYCFLNINCVLEVEKFV